VTVALVDYGMGNRRSVEKALERVGARVALTGDHDALRGAVAIDPTETGVPSTKGTLT